MKKVDYIIVGQGVAGSCFALKLLQQNKSFLVIDSQEHMASKVAVGIYNPVVLKRFALIWKAQQQLDRMHQYFRAFESLLGGQYVHEIPTYRILKDDNEIHAWNLKAEKPELSKFLDTTIRQDAPEKIHAPKGFAEVKQTGRIDLSTCLQDFRNFLKANQFILEEKFDYHQIVIEENHVLYQDIQADKLVFCDGFGIKENPYFNYLPIIGVKGEVLKIKTETSISEGIWKAHNFLLEIEPRISLTASTYDRDDLSPEPTEKGKQEILSYLGEIYSGKVEVLEHWAGIRPTVLDRRPVIGAHPKVPHIYLFNGMGTRGTLLAPDMTEELFAFIEEKQALDKEADLNRFTKKHFPND
ncbi:NAD(P)/FAD-dependent oxidoreductase [Moheibacter stercoris]|uniref:Glycine/D-amino acid oxidase-like deaminating enzyme n=1 Tax=Moheibacter stercoris TaxID=1628251 RepID=A0ABV2LQA9_9FLAO